LGGPAVARSVREARERAVAEAVGYVELQAAIVSRGHARERQDLAAGVVAAAYWHRTSLTKSASRYRFRYTGLRLIVRSGGKYFLVPAGWSSQNGASAFVIPDGDDFRLEFQPGSTS
jgi:hypothetical protein